MDVARPRPVDYLQPGEEVQHEEGRRFASIVDAITGLTVVAVVLGVAGGVYLRAVGGMEFFGPSLLTLTTLYVWGLLLIYWRVRTSRYVITADRVYRTHGRWRFQMLQTTYDKVTDLSVRQSLMGRWFGFGSITIQTAGTGLQMDGVDDPYAMKRSIEQARATFLQTLIAEHRLAGAKVAGAGATAGAEAATSGLRARQTASGSHGNETEIWNGQPALASVIVGLIPGLFFVLFAFVFFTGGVLSGEGVMMYVGLGILIVPVFLTLGAWVQYKFTRYAVAEWGVVVTSGWLTRKRVETTYAKVTDVTTYEGIVGRIFKFGNITINTAGSNDAPVVFAGVGDPERIKQLIDDVREGRRRAPGVDA